MLNTTTEPKPDVFLKQWLLCGPFPLFRDADQQPPDEAAQKEAFGIDFLTEHGGEEGIRPAPGVTHHRDGAEYTWRSVTAATDTVDLAAILGPRTFATAYAWTEIEASAPTKAILGVGSDDAVKLWLNGEPVHEYWGFRAVTIDNDLVVVHLHEGKNRLLLKVQNAVGDWGFACRLIGPATAQNALASAVSAGRRDAIELLLALGADVHARDLLGRTPLHHAAHLGHAEGAETLLDHAAEIDALSRDRLTPLHLARRAGRQALVERLLARGADPKRQPAEAPVQIDTLFTLTETGDHPGAAVLVIQDGRILHQKGYGLADLERRRPIRPDTTFYLASVSKQFTTMAIMLLAEEGRFDYDDPVVRFLPEFGDRGNAITVRHLLHHTGGLPDYFGLTANQGSDTLADITNRAVLDLVLQQPQFQFAPGERFEYTNSGYTTLAMIVHKASGQPFHRFLKARVFDPLGMKNTLVYDESKPAVREIALGYAQEGDAYRRWDYDLLTAGDGGMFSTVEDLYLWDQALSTETLVKTSTLEQAWTPGTLNDGSETGYGFGWSIRRVRGLREIAHSGGLNVYNTRLARFPDERFTVIVLSNSRRFRAGETADQIAELYLSEKMEPQT